MDELFKQLIIKGYGLRRIVSEIYSMNNDETTKAEIAEALEIYLIDLAKRSFQAADLLTAK